jgi:peroxin-6
VVVFVATTDDIDTVSIPIQSRFSHQIAIPSPDEKARLEMLQALLNGVSVGFDVNVKTLATKTAAMLPVDLCQLVSDAISHSIKRIANSK